MFLRKDCMELNKEHSKTKKYKWKHFYLIEGWPWTTLSVILIALKLFGVLNISWWIALLPLYFWWPLVFMVIAFVSIKVILEDNVLANIQGFIFEKVKSWFTKK